MQPSSIQMRIMKWNTRTVSIRPWISLKKMKQRVKSKMYASLHLYTRHGKVEQLWWLKHDLFCVLCFECMWQFERIQFFFTSLTVIEMVKRVVNPLNNDNKPTKKCEAKKIYRDSKLCHKGNSIELSAWNETKIEIQCFFLFVG